MRSLVAPPSGATLDPFELPDVTVPATNFLPSPLTPFGPLLIVLAVVSAAMLWIWWRWLGTKWGGLPWVLAAAVGVLAGIGVEFADYRSDRAGSPGPSAIVAEPLAVSGDASKGRVGVVLDDQGDIAELTVSDGQQLLVDDLEHAGAYKGKLDLNGAAEGGAAAAAVNVRDWWPWAMAAIALGVLVGYRVRMWFARDRPRAQSRMRARGLSSRVRTKLAETRRPEWVPRQRVDLRVAAIEQSLAERDTTADADTQVDSLAGYVETAEKLLADVVDLESAVDRYDQVWPALELGVDAGEVAAAVNANALLGDGFDAPRADTDGTELKAAVDSVAGALLLVEAATAALKAISVWLGRLSQQDEIQSPGGPSPDETERDALVAAAFKVIRATSVDTVEKAYAEASASASGAPAQRTPLRDMVPVRPPPPTIETDIAAPPNETPGNIDDVFRFRLVNAAAIPVTWAFGDRHEVPGQAGEWTDHVYTRIGSFNVEARGPDGTLLAVTTVQVSGPSRDSEDRVTVAERDKVFTKVAVALTVASGMLSLYLVDPAWGTTEDYLKALLWGAVISEGVAYVAAILAHLAPGGK